MGEENVQEMSKRLIPFFKTGTLYSITINPVDRFQFFGNPLRLQKFRSHVYEAFLPLECKYRLFIELSEPNGFKTSGYKGPRLHCHGIINFPKKKHLLSFLMDYYYRILRTMSVDIDTISDKEYWLNYCTKQNLIENNIIHNYVNIGRYKKNFE